MEDVPFYAKIWHILTHPVAKADFQSVFRSERLKLASSSKIADFQSIFAIFSFFSALIL